jgi:hypothetical protein
VGYNQVHMILPCLPIKQAIGECDSGTRRIIKRTTTDPLHEISDALDLSRCYWRNGTLIHRGGYPVRLRTHEGVRHHVRPCIVSLGFISVIHRSKASIMPILTDSMTATNTVVSVLRHTHHLFYDDDIATITRHRQRNPYRRHSLLTARTA